MNERSGPRGIIMEATAVAHQAAYDNHVRTHDELRRLGISACDFGKALERYPPAQTHAMRKV